MSIKASLSSDGFEEVYTAPTLKEMCLYKCLTNKKILTKEVEVDEPTNGSEKLDWEKFRLKEPIQRELLEALLDAGDKHMFELTSKYEPILAAIRMSQPQHLVKVHVSNAKTLTDVQLECLISGGNVKSLDIHGCVSLMRWSLYSINEFGSKLEYLRIGDSYQVLLEPMEYFLSSAILRTPYLKTFILFEMRSGSTNFWTSLLHDFISNLEELGLSKCGRFETLEFLEPAKNRLSSLTLADCHVNRNANAWASLFELTNLRSLDLMGSEIGEAFAGENVVERLLTALPHLTHLAVDPGLVIAVNTSIRGQGRQGQGSVAKRLEFLGVMDNNDEAEIRKAKLLANDVAYFGTVEGELSGLEYFSRQLTVTLNSGSGYFQRTLERLLKSLSEVAGTPPCNTVTVIDLFLKTFKSSGASDINLVASRILKKMLTPDIAAKLGNARLDQCIEAICCFMRKWLVFDRNYFAEEREFISHVLDIIMNLDEELCLHHYKTVVPLVMCLAEKVTFSIFVLNDDIDVEENLYKKIELLLAKIVDRFPGETNELWGISSVLEVIKEFKGELEDLRDDEDDEDNRIRRQSLVEIFSSMIASLRKLCLNSGPRRAAFHSAKGVEMLMNLLIVIIDGWLDLADRDSFALLEILQSLLQDTKLDMAESGMIASELEDHLLFVHLRWERRKSSSPNPDRDASNYLKRQTISSLLNYLESDPRFNYEKSGATKDIIMKLK